MPEQSTARVTSVEQAIDVLIAWQVDQGAVPTQPAWHATEETQAGWVFFNLNGYLGTVTEDGDVIEEADIVARDRE
jgi:hypothetical protein